MYSDTTYIRNHTFLAICNINMVKQYKTPKGIISQFKIQQRISIRCLFHCPPNFNLRWQPCALSVWRTSGLMNLPVTPSLDAASQSHGVPGVITIRRDRQGGDRCISACSPHPRLVVSTETHLTSATHDKRTLSNDTVTAVIHYRIFHGNRPSS